MNAKQSVVMRSCLETRAAGQLDDEAIWRLEPGRGLAVLFDGASMRMADRELPDSGFAAHWRIAPV